MVTETKTTEDKAREVLRQYYVDLDKQGGPDRNLITTYENAAIEYTHRGFQSLTYLNGGALVAIPAALTLLKAAETVSKIAILLTAGSFVVGLLLIVAAQVCAFFTISKRSLAAQLRYFGHQQELSILHFPAGSKEQQALIDSTADFRSRANKDTGRSNFLRWVGVVCFLLSMLLFIASCGLGAWSILNTSA